MTRTAESVDAQWAKLDRIFRPSSIAIVGASGRPENLFARPLRLLLEHGFAGRIYPVNPSYSELLGVACYPTLDDVPGPVDLVLVLVQAAAAIEVVRRAGGMGAAAVVLFTSGFAESGPDGQRLQAELAAAARESGIRVLGPNCQGLICTKSAVYGTFTAAADQEMPPQRGLAYVGQSGAIGGSVLDLVIETGIGMTAWVSTGNQVDLDVPEVATYLLADPSIQVIMLYLEDISDGASYTRLAETAHAVGKQLIALRAGSSVAGKRAASSHTGTMLGNDLAFETTSARFGVIQVDDVDELVAVATAAVSMQSPKGRRVGIVTTSGGAGSLAADQCTKNALEVAELGPRTREVLAGIVPAFGSVQNPVDVTAQLFSRGDVNALARVCQTVARDDAVDCVAVVMTMLVGDQAARLAETLVAASAQMSKPLFVVWIAGRDRTIEGRQIYRASGFPVFGSVRDMSRAVSLLTGPNAGEGGPDRSADESTNPDAVAMPSRGEVRSMSARELLRALDIAVPRSLVATRRGEAEVIGERFGPVVAMKLHAESVAHKSDIGAVRLQVTPDEVGPTFDELIEIAHRHGIPDVTGVEIQETVPAGIELIIAATNLSDGYPSLVTVGIGGIATELERNLITRVAPVDTTQALAMLKQLRIWPLLDGYRGLPRRDVAAAVRAVVNVSRLATVLDGDYFEFELNPIIVLPAGEGAVAVDVLLRLRPAGSQHPRLIRADRRLEWAG